ncbi:TPA: AAA family ATPase [Vibrio vulnificus]|uniref:AAA family ATPase n=1 Tax=Vibrio vulnificus TaxID=672 RepID=UPI00030577FC|nr:AAA family ATPase [Vibrio vulnificus]
MKLISLQLVGKGKQGWSSEELHFGEHITHLWGPNGCGKTPIVQSIAFCLGFPCVFRQDIYDHVNYAVLNVEVQGKRLSITRVFGTEVDIEVVEGTSVPQKFYNDDEYSEYLFELFFLERPDIISTANKSIKPYLSTLLPLVYLDQDDGYRGHYYSKFNFIKDQFEEMIRILFKLPPKNSFNKKKQAIIEKEKLAQLDKAVHLASRRYETQKELVSDINKTSEEIYEEIEMLDKELDNLKSFHSNHDDSLNALDKIISSHKRTIHNIDEDIRELHYRTKGVESIIAEINTEVDTLNLNEEARRVFVRSSDLCSSSNCQLFSSSSDSYSKNLLYLRDQIKDLERNAENDLSRIDELKRRRTAVEELTRQIVEERNNAIEKTEASALVEAISEIKNQLFGLQVQQEKLDNLDKLSTIYFDLLSDQRRAVDRVASLSSSRNSVPEIIQLKSRFKQLLIKWLESIGTINVNLDIKWKNDFVPLFGVESIEQLKGSTRARVVLAYHAALIELLLESENVALDFIILDTPKQHEIHDNDLDNFMISLKKLCKQYSLQVVFSTTEYKYKGDSQDCCWEPKFPGLKQKMFLKAGE